jgi:hypothetical protein
MKLPQITSRRGVKDIQTVYSVFATHCKYLCSPEILMSSSQQVSSVGVRETTSWFLRTSMRERSAASTARSNLIGASPSQGSSRFPDSTPEQNVVKAARLQSIGQALLNARAHVFKAEQKSGLISAPRLPQAPQTNCGSISDRRISSGQGSGAQGNAMAAIVVGAM